MYDFIRPYAATVLEHATSFEHYSRFPVWSVNVANGFPTGIRDLDFDVVLLHYSLFGSKYYRLDGRFLAYLDRTPSYKVAFFQDEYYFCRQRFDFLNRYAIDCVFTLLAPAQVPAVYGANTSVRRVESTIPGFVSDDLIDAAARFARPTQDRTIDIGYRTRSLPYYMGRGAQEKHLIGLGVRGRMHGSDLAVDIAVDEPSRLYGEDWYRFLGNCRAVLGVESGVSIFDIEDVVRSACDDLLARDPALTFEEVFDRVLRPWEGNIPYRTISPRHFEAAAFRCCQLLFEGDYSGILIPMRHYLPLKKDFSNFDDVMALYRDAAVREELTRCAHDELIASGVYSYRAFVGRFDEVLQDVGFRPERGVWERAVTSRVRRWQRIRTLEHRGYRWLRWQRGRVRGQLERLTGRSLRRSEK